MKINISDVTLQSYNDAFDKCQKLFDDIEEILKYLIRLTPGHEPGVYIPFLEVPLENLYKFYVNDKGKISAYPCDDKNNIIEDFVSKYPDSSFMIIWLLIRETTVIESADIEDMLQQTDSEFRAQIDVFFNLLKAIIKEQDSQCIIKSFSLFTGDDDRPYHFCLNTQGEIIFYKDDEQNDYTKYGKSNLLFDSIDMAPIYDLYRLLRALKEDFCETVNTSN